MIAFAHLTTEPEIEDVAHEGGTMRAYTARGELVPGGKVVQVVILPAVDGDHMPYGREDRVLVAVAGGVAYVLREAVAHTADADGLNRYVQAPGQSSAPGKGSTPEVRIGARTGGSWEALMLWSRARAEIVELKAQIDQVVTSAKASADPGVAAFGAALETALTTRDAAIGTITGGKAANGAQGRPSS